MNRILKAREVAARTSISIPHIRRMASDGKFPKPMKISDCRSGWLEAEVEVVRERAFGAHAQVAQPDDPLEGVFRLQRVLVCRGCIGGGGGGYRVGWGGGG